MKEGLSKTEHFIFGFGLGSIVILLFMSYTIGVIHRNHLKEINDLKNPQTEVNIEELKQLIKRLQE